MSERYYPLYRPPSEAESLILPVTIGCSHNRCHFCSMYRDRRFRPLPLSEVQAAIGEARRELGEVSRVFLADGDAFCLSSRRLRAILEALHASFSRLQRVSAYANARDVLRKSDEELCELRELGLRLIYLGLESGDDETLARIEKGATAAQMIEAVRRARAAGLSTSVMVLIGLAGPERSVAHARASATALNRMEPTYTALLTYTPTPASPLGEAVARGEQALLSPLESLLEIRELVAHLECPTSFSCNHASNYLPLRGRLPGAKPALLALLDSALDGRVALKPEFLRGL